MDINNYRVLRELGRNREGGRITYLAECRSTQQMVVIKQFRFAQESSWQAFKTYEREIQILQEIDHPRIPQYLNSFETSDGFCMVQEYKDAPDLATKKSFTPQEIKQITVSILEILVDLQQRIPPIIHRDLKPENILVDQNNQAYLIDFGLARVDDRELAISSVIAGTPGFMPPEALFNRPLTTASDLYSVGATAIALITNTPASQLNNLIDDNYQFQFSHLLTQINPDFIAWLNKMVAPNLQDRFHNAQAALAKLQPIDITGTSITASNRQSDTMAFAVAGTAMVIILLAIFGIVRELKPIAKSDKSSRSTKSVRVKEPSYGKKTQGWVRDPSRQPVSVIPGSHVNPLMEAERWYQQIKPHCNSLEVVTAMRNTPYPFTLDGVGYAAACYALAGRLDLADREIKKLPKNFQGNAAMVLFKIGHPIADAGDDRSAGAIMDLVVRYLPKNYMALYHAGMSAYVLDDYGKAQAHLKDFLRIYQRQDGWTNKAKNALSRMEQDIPADASFSIHH